MRGTNCALILVLLVTLVPVSTSASAKGVTTQITLTDLSTGTSVDMTNPRVLRDFNVWAGPGTWSGNTEGTDGFIVDWRSGIAPEPLSGLRTYEVAFYTAALSAPLPREPEYVVLFVFDRLSSRGYVYLPAKGDKWYETNVRAIYRRNEGHWFFASEAWQRAIQPLGLVSTAAQDARSELRCLHGPNESPAERDRRNAAIRLARMINTAEVTGRTNSGMPYQPLSAIRNLTVPDRWDPRLVTDGATYAFSVKDTTDPCGFTLFSDDTGIIYVGEAMR